jgi:hypothetical protein
MEVQFCHAFANHRTHYRFATHVTGGGEGGGGRGRVGDVSVVTVSCLDVAKPVQSFVLIGIKYTLP